MAEIVSTPRPAPVDVDPATLDIVENALRNARVEMDAVLFRTAMSPGIREQHDAFPLIADREGRMVAGQFGSFIDGFLSAYSGRIDPGDVFFTSDPYSCDGAISHANDWLVLMPIHQEGLLVGWAAMFGHMSDVGGKVPGSLPTDATSIFEEGLVIPPVKIIRDGVFDEQLVEAVLNQVRLPRWNRSDLHALIAACRTAEARMLELCDRFGTARLLSAMDELLARNHRAMAKLFREVIPTEPVHFEDFVDDDGRGFGPFRISCRLWREGDGVVLDFSDTDPQAEGSINFLLNENVLRMFFGVYTIMAFDPQILFNDGFYPLVDVRIPSGSLLKPERPAALSCRTHALGRLFDVLAGLLGQCRPEFLAAAGFSSSPHLMYSGTGSDGEWYQLYQIGFGGVPGRPLGDGFDGHSMWPSFTNVPNEFLEAYYPLRVERYESIPDTGGAGRHRGGNGLRAAYRLLEPGEISIHDDRWFTSPWGALGGEPGARSEKVLTRGDGTVERLAAKCDHVAVEAGDLLEFNTWGGGGWGDPLEREPEAVAADVARGLVTPVGAERYGVSLTAEGEVDAPATAALRRSMATGRGPLEMFVRGASIDERRATCEAETGLPAPVAPRARQRPAAAVPDAPALRPVAAPAPPAEPPAARPAAASPAPAAPVAAARPPQPAARPLTALEELVHRIAREVVGNR